MWKNTKKQLKHASELGKSGKGGVAIKEKYGREHFVNLAKKSAQVRRSKTIPS